MAAAALAFACTASGATGICDGVPAALVAMREADQALRNRVFEPGADSARIGERMSLVDRSNTRQLAALVTHCGWPTLSRHGRTASDDAFLLAQHADQDRTFQRYVLHLLEKLVAVGEARRLHLAYLSDRLAVADRRPQLYGTQLSMEGCGIELAPMDSREAVEARRSTIEGMPPLRAYEDWMRREFGSQPGCIAVR